MKRLKQLNCILWFDGKKIVAYFHKSTYGCVNGFPVEASLQKIIDLIENIVKLLTLELHFCDLTKKIIWGVHKSTSGASIDFRCEQFAAEIISSNDKNYKWFLKLSWRKRKVPLIFAKFTLHDCEIVTGKRNHCGNVDGALHQLALKVS